ncbi:hypothetical protein B5F79_06515 [Olsenella sp. An285]|uniref:glycosyltransferase n=1 Tax=Olsenella sp. An285 TaxID=1965621 RepID=UPI000B38825D|nr:glycosyltransferase [Olsenella sp. An285]OUO46571.1 hypothetical protein B5F79_06515 [Olsenella sp. An285]
MRILVTGFTANYGGVESLVMGYYREMKKLDDALVFDLLGYADEPAYREEIARLGGKVYTVPSPKHAGHRKALKEFFHVHGGEYDALWCNKCDLHDIGYLQAARSCIPKRILHAHSSRLNYDGVRMWLFGFLHRVHKAQASACATDLWACSDWAAEWMFPRHKFSDVRFVPNAIRLETFTFDGEARQAYRDQLSVSGTVYGCVGRLNENKNIAFALRAFRHVWEQQRDSYLLVVGTGELEAAHKAEAAAMPCKNNVIFLGMRQDVPQLLQAMDCLLMPSLFEGFPVAPIEAQAAGLPVFAASDGITPQARLTDLFHFLPLSLGPEGWAEQILKADLARKDCLGELREKGFDITAAAQQLLDAFRQ